MEMGFAGKRTKKKRGREEGDGKQKKIDWDTWEEVIKKLERRKPAERVGEGWDKQTRIAQVKSPRWQMLEKRGREEDACEKRTGGGWVEGGFSTQKDLLRVRGDFRYAMGGGRLGRGWGGSVDGAVWTSVWGSRGRSEDRGIEGC